MADGTIRCERAVGSEREVYAVPLPAVITVRDGLNIPRYPSVPGRIKARKKPVTTHEVTLADARIVKQRLVVPPAAVKGTTLSSRRAGRGRTRRGLPRDRGAVMILVHVDHDRGVLDPVSLQALTLARALDPDVQAVVAGDAGPLAAELAAHGAAVIHVADNAVFADFAPQATGRAIADLVGTLSPAAVLAGGTARGNEVMAHAAAFLDAPLAADCTSITLGTPSRIVRARWGGNLLEEATVDARGPARHRAAHAVVAEPSAAAGEVRTFTAQLSEADTAVRILERTGAPAAGVTLAEARAVVSGGRGMGGPEAFSMLEELAALLGGTVGCSRVVTSEGWRPHAEQVGQTGTKVAPDLYVACGISGATQHLAGCKNSKTLVAINTDAEAPIMQAADYAVVGDVHAFLPLLLAQTKAASAG